jgi:hypothetical protein
MRTSVRESDTAWVGAVAFVEDLEVIARDAGEELLEKVG